MINAVIFSLLLAGTPVNNSCPPIKIINETLTWNENDGRVLRSTIRRCPVKYPDSPCLKKFWKKEEMTYWALCGRSR